MHMADALLSPLVGAAFWSGTAATLAYASKKLKEGLDDRLIPLMGVLGAFVFAAQMINFTIPGTGSSGHFAGGMLLSILLGPYAAFLVMASVLTVQALFFADGGLLALGCNIWNLAFYPSFVAYPLIYRPLVASATERKRIVFAALISSIVSLQLGAFSVVLQTLFSDRSELPFTPFVLAMQPIHFAIGIVEGLITGGVISYVRSVRPEILQGISSGMPVDSRLSFRKFVMTLGLAALLTGGVFSWFASTHPDGLEWSIEKAFGGNENPEPEHNIASALKKAQEKTAFMPNYSFGNKEDGAAAHDEAPASWPSIEAGTSSAGIIGAIAVFIAASLIGMGIRFLRRRTS